MAFYHPFINIIKTLRSGAYFGQALENNNCDSIRQARDKDPNKDKISTKLIYSGIIFATTALIAGRSIYKWGKSKINKMIKKHKAKNKAYQEKQRQEALKNDKPIEVPTGQTINAPIIASPKSQSQNDKPIFVPQKSDQQIIDTKQETDKFAYDIPLSSAGIELLSNLKLFRNIKDKNKFGTYYLKAQTKNNEKIIMFNNSGIFDTKHNLLFNENNNLIDLSELLNKYNSMYHYDLCQLCKYFIKQ